ncbi:matrixin family metalloprotease [Limosilactobacillus sp.]|uniref:matrixin family metalloprotease n=1 Tax=Limosilactobacillus sp. TaxID=2773925 RepID=UPI0035A023EE
MKKHLLIITIILVGILLLPVHVAADNVLTAGQPSVFDAPDDGQLSVYDDSSQAVQAGKHRLYLPTNTPTPIENYRWPTRKLKIYMDTSDRPIQQAFKGAVQAWNRTGAVHIKWCRNESQADIIARDGALSNTGAAPGVGYVSAQLGSTNTEYNPDTNALIQARSTLDASHLDYASRSFRTEVAEHELGHALGLAHAPEYVHSVMIPRNIRTGITHNDRKTLRQLYDVGR